jgi:23S rRNA (adenine2503-C2)-methyltransferase
MNQLKTLAGLTLPEIEKLTSLPRFRSGQIYRWIIRGQGDFDKMTDIPNSLRDDLKTRFKIFSSSVDQTFDDAGTKKTVITLNDGLKVEAVLLSDGKKRLTACLSTQAGCPAACVFCKTGSLGFKRDLECAEIVEQFIFLLAQAAGESGIENKEQHIIGNIVVMGMGEPLLNLQQLRKSIAFFTDRQGMNLSLRRITVSTCGIIPALFDIAENGPYFRLALSLVTADEDLRQRLMPIAAANPLSKVKEALVLYQRNGGGRVTLEALLLGGVNTRDEDAKYAADFAKGLDTVINIIPWNPVAGLEFEGRPLREPEKKETENFIRTLEKHGLKVTMRLRKGQRVMGACGQLGSLFDLSQEDV